MRNWPLTGIVVRTPLLELRYPTDSDLDDLADVARAGVHDPAVMPFFSAWTDGDPGVVAQRVVRRLWAAAGAWSADDWTLYLAVVHEGTVVGAQSIGAREFAVTREILVTAWLGQQFQGSGIGTEARAAMLSLAFDGLGAEQVLSVVQHTNQASQAVCRKLGFLHDGTQTNQVRGGRVRSDRYRLSRERWGMRARPAVEIEGLAAALRMFGVGPVPPPEYVAVQPTAEVLSGVRFSPECDAAVD